MLDHLVGQPLAVINSNVRLRLAEESKELRLAIEFSSDAAAKDRGSCFKPFNCGINVGPASPTEDQGVLFMPPDSEDLLATAKRTLLPVGELTGICNSFVVSSIYLLMCILISDEDKIHSLLFPLYCRLRWACCLLADWSC